MVGIYRRTSLAHFSLVTSTCLHNGPFHKSTAVLQTLDQHRHVCSCCPRPGQYAGMNNIAWPSLYILLTLLMQSSAQEIARRWYFWSFTLLLNSDTNVSALLFTTPCGQISKPFIPFINDHECIVKLYLYSIRSDSSAHFLVMSAEDVLFCGVSAGIYWWLLVQVAPQQ